MPPDFADASADRHELWEALPDTARAHISQLRACDEEGREVVDLVWGLRFADADAFMTRLQHSAPAITALSPALPFEVGALSEAADDYIAGLLARVEDGCDAIRLAHDDQADAPTYKMQLLRRAHGIVLERLRREWDTVGGQPGEPRDTQPEDLTLRDLGSDLLEHILKRLPQPDISEGAQRPAVPCCAGQSLVCRLFEALIYATATSCLVVHDQPEHSFRSGLSVLERASLAQHLGAVSVGLPRIGARDSHTLLCMRAVAAMLRQCTTVTELCLSKPCSFAVIGPARVVVASDVVLALGGCQRLRTLRLQGLTVSVESDGELATAVAALPALETFEASFCEWAPAARLRAALDGLAALRRVKLVHNSGLCGLPLLATVPSMRDLELADVDLSYNDAALPAGPLPLERLGIELKGAGRFNNLIRPAPCSAADVTRLVRIIRRMPGLRHLNLGVQDVSDASKAEIFAALQCLTSLTSIELRMWVPPAFGTLPSCTQLRALTLHLLTHRAEWVPALASLLRTCSALTTIDFAYLRWPASDAAVADAVLPVLAQCPVLECLTVQYTSFNLVQLCRSLQHHPTLRKLHIQDRDASKHAVMRALVPFVEAVRYG